MLSKYKLLLIIKLIVAGSLVFSETSQLTIEGMKNTIFPKTPLIFESQIGSYELYTSHDVSFEVSGIKEYALLSKPKANKPSNGYPVIILIHGHIPPTQYSTFNSYKYMFNRYASSEFVVIKPDLRGHGRSQLGTEDMNNVEKLYYTLDILQLINSLDTVDFINTDEIFLMGHSNGGDSVIRILSVYPEKIKAASMWAPVTVKLEESNFYYKGRGKYNYGLEAVTNQKSRNDLLTAEKALNSSLKAIGITDKKNIRYDKYMGKIITPIKIRHADTDKSVPFSWSLSFIERYKKSGNPLKIEIINYPGDDHNMAKNQAIAQKADLIWFRSILKK